MTRPVIRFRTSCPPRAIDCIYLRSLDNRQGGHEVLNLITGRVIKRRQLTKVPTTDAVISRVHELANDASRPSTKKLGFADPPVTSVAVFDDNRAGVLDVIDTSLPDEVTAGAHAPADSAGVDAGNTESTVSAESTGEAPDDNDGHTVSTESTGEATDDVDGPTVSTEHLKEDDVSSDISSHGAFVVPGDNATPEVRRSSRVRVPTARYQLSHVKGDLEYDSTSCHAMGQIFAHYGLARGLAKFGSKGEAAVVKEISQLVNRAVFEPVDYDALSEKERRQAMESLIFLNEKRDGTIKARACANGSSQRDYVPKEEASSPTAATEAIILTSVIDAKQGRDVMTLDIPNAFVQTDIPDSDDRIMMKIRGKLVDVMVELFPGKYETFVKFEGRSKVLYVMMKKALYGMLTSSMLYYKKFRSDIKELGFIINPYDGCVANRWVNGMQHTIVWHVDDVKSSVLSVKINDDFAAWCDDKYGSDELGHVTITRGKKHDYLAMILDFSTTGVLKLEMKYYIEGMVKDFPHELTCNGKTPWTERLFKTEGDAAVLEEQRKKTFHTFLMKMMFLSKRGRPDIDLAVSFLATRVKAPTEGDWKKLTRLLKFLSETIDDVLTLEADDTQTLYCLIDVSFAVHKDMKSHTGSVFSLGKGAIMASSTKQKTNSRSSTEGELKGIDDRISKIMWTKRFLEAQGFAVNVKLAQDNTSTIKLALNGKESSGKRTRHFEIQLYYITDLIKRGELMVKYCPTDLMIADYMTKPLVGTKFKKMRNWIMNHVGQQECVGELLE